MGKLTDKGKHIEKVGNHPHTNMISKLVIMREEEYKCKIFEMHLKLGDQQLKIIMYMYRMLYQNLMEGFPGGAVVENLPANAGDTGLSPGLGRSHMPRNNWAREPQLLSLRVWSLCSATREAAIVRGPRTVMKSGPCLPQLEKALAQKQRPNTAINK